MEQRKNFFDEIEQEWGDVITNTYTEANKKHLLLKINTKTKNNKLFWKMFDFENVQENDELSFYITEENIQEALKEYMFSFFEEDKTKYIQIPFDLIDIKLNDKPIKINKIPFIIPTYDIKLGETNEIIYFRILNLCYGHVYSVLDYQADCRYFTYYKEHENKDLNDFIITFNKDLFKNYKINL